MCYNSIIGTDFNPRSREGSDTMSKKPIDFNPRSREGSDCVSINGLMPVT